MTYATASYRQSCKGTDNTLQSGDPGYRYVTARIPASFLDDGVYAGFYVTLENGVDIICTERVACSPEIEGSELSDNAEDNIVVGMLVVLGDVNCDGEVTYADVTALSLFLMGSGELTEQGLLNADINCDGEITFLDVTALYLFLMGGISDAE